MWNYRSPCLTTLLFLLAGCTSANSCHVRGASSEPTRTIYVVQRAWHTGVAIAASDWPTRDWSVLTDFPEADYLEFGWGDEQYYKSEKKTLWLGSRAALWPTSSVVHVIGLREPILSNVRADGIVEIKVSASGLRKLTTSIERQFADPKPTSVGHEIHSAPTPNRFYAGERSFFFPRMCNWWTAERLQAAGCPIKPWTVVTASRVMREAQGFADRETSGE